MPIYTVRFKDEVVTKVDTEAPLVRIGRSEDCEVRIDNLGVSRFHAVIELKDGVRILRDLGSHNGVYFAGKMVKSRVLNDGDVFVIGKYRLEYRGEVPGITDEPAAAPQHEPVVADEAGLMRTFAIAPSSVAHLRQSEQVVGHLKRDDGKFLDLRQTITTFGKHVRCDHKVSGFFTPRILAILVRDERGFIVVNASGIPEKVLVQGRPLQMYVRLENGFKVTLGKHVYTFLSGRPVEGDSGEHYAIPDNRPMP
ncbi:MAG: FHA domain-containing protein [Planctomycetes bacterium]|nr:FHA domain-containing protein [Planctomycetota bacterium]